jgi:hypothetical protein
VNETGAGLNFAQQLFFDNYKPAALLYRFDPAKAGMVISSCTMYTKHLPPAVNFKTI